MERERFIRIDDAADPRIAAYRDIREKDLVGRNGHFIAEGEVVLRALANAPHHRAVSILIVEKRLERLGPLLAAFPAGTAIYVASQPVLDAIAGFPMHRGVLALGARGPARAARALLADLPQRACVAVLFAIANHDNMGGIFRNAAAFGLNAILLDSRCCDPFYRKAIRVSVGASLAVPSARFGADEEILDTLAGYGFRSYALAPRGGAMLDALAPSARAALLFGPEGPGLPDDVLAGAVRATIAMAPGFDSLNVATASGIAMHHFTRGQWN